jgi:radical SAM protein with 4Fe4S-binding SPASM domain
MDLAVTYRCNANCAHCYNARPRAYPELATQDWIEVLRLVRQAGIPHVCFTGGEATLREDLPELVAAAHAEGLVVGLLSNGRRLAERGFSERLMTAGLDHVQITLESHDPSIHDRMVRAQGAWEETVAGVRNALDAGLYLMTNTTLLEDNAATISETIDFLSVLGVPTVGCNALIYSGKGAAVGAGLAESELRALLPRVRAQTERNQQKLIWYSPTQYCHFDPVQLELGVKGCTAARYNLCLEPDGEVIPCQSYYQGLGNILAQPWEAIWNHPLAVWLRERRYVPEACQDCPVVSECGGGCPLSLPHLAPDLERAAAIPVPA